MQKETYTASPIFIAIQILIERSQRRLTGIGFSTNVENGLIVERHPLGELKPYWVVCERLTGKGRNAYDVQLRRASRRRRTE